VRNTNSSHDSRSADVRLLALLRSSAQQQINRVAGPPVADPVARAEADAGLPHLAIDLVDIAGQATLHLDNLTSDGLPGFLVGQAIEQVLELVGLLDRIHVNLTRVGNAIFLHGANLP
jgi:hypothetical protein